MLTMRTLTLILLAALAGCASPPPAEKGDVMVTVKAARVEQCNNAGGCALLSQAEVASMLAEAYGMGAAQALEDLDSHGCKRGKL
jgi:hypothetical protein